MTDGRLRFLRAADPARDHHALGQGGIDPAAASPTLADALTPKKKGRRSVDPAAQLWEKRPPPGDQGAVSGHHQKLMVAPKAI